ncbi:MAG TPA: 23S rRNA (uracil(1939)-C(5))-methyltransferase RlmD, partial [Tetragenococcus sp.]|nr:23S rRNA (uracil(1939)-C(5))-methyltransferase RlmD [Tetragenococcus sp.]
MEVPVKKNQELEVEIIDLTHQAMGVAKIDGFPVFIENTLPQENARIKIIKVGKKFAIGKCLELIKTSPHRQEVENEDLLRTGIAPLSHLSYPQQLLFKQDQVENVIKKVAKMPEIKVAPTMGMKKPDSYRNKAQIPVQKIHGQLTTGFYHKNSHRLVSVDDFMIQDKKIDQVIAIVREILQFYKVKAYNEQAHEGFLRHIIIRRGHYSHEMMVVLVTRKEKFFKGPEIAQKIHERLPEVVSVMQNINSEQTNVILGEQEKVLYGQAYLTDQLLGKKFRIS